MPPPPSKSLSTQTWLVIGATRGIGLEFTTQLLQQGHTVYATYRTSKPHDSLSDLSSNFPKLRTLECDVSNEESIAKLKGEIYLEAPDVIDVVVVNAGILEYPGRISEISFDNFQHHLQTNTIGPLLTASSLLSLPKHIKTLVFISSDSGSAQSFRGFEDGFGAYSVSKAALNQGLRHLACELQRKREGKENTVVLALHPGEVDTDMCGDVELGWEVKGVMTPEESIRCMLEVIKEKGYGGINEGGKASALVEGREYEEGEASFWTWDGRRYPW